MHLEILEYNEDNFLTALNHASVVSEEKLRNRKHFKYFSRYLSEEKGLGAQMIVKEDEYISKAYLSDYSSYYSSCFQQYDRLCRRVHLFNVFMDDKKFYEELTNLESDYLQKHYLGYIVTKPLPDSIIGATLLVSYNKKNDDLKRFYPGCRNYDVNLFGRRLVVNTMAYQEQDTVVSACATVAIWSALHKTAVLFQMTLPSPNEITTYAGNLFINTGRSFPSEGLDVNQICSAVDKCGLVSELRNLKKFEHDLFMAKRIIYAYLRAGLPVLLLTKSDPKSAIGHVITINGYSDINPDIPEDKTLNMSCDKIEKFFAHDDQLGPFAKLEFSGNTALRVLKWDKDGNEKWFDEYIRAVVIPLYPKIRIKYEEVLQKVLGLDFALKKLIAPTVRFEWDVYLIESSQYKHELLQNAEDGVRKEILFKNYPKYIWVARGSLDNNVIFDFIFDSTDIAYGHFLIDFKLHDPSTRLGLLYFFSEFQDLFTTHKSGPRFDEELYNKRIITELKKK